MSDLPSFAEASPVRFAAALAAAVQEVTRRSPAPRDLPFFGLDHAEGAGPAALERLSDLGIFRFYERVLDVGAGIGGPARWLARRRGCRVVCRIGDASRAVAARALVGRSHLEPRVAVVVGRGPGLPFADEAFTHAWGVEPGLGDEPGEALRELWRALRPGGFLALQDVFSPPGSAGTEPAPTADGLTAALAAAGFVEIRASAVPPGEGESSVAAVAARRAAERLGPARPDEDAALAAAADRLERRRRALAAGRLTALQIFARKPA